MFADFFLEEALKNSTIVLGLYRPVAQELGNQMPFVYTNPYPSIPLIKGDEVFALRLQQ
jgi:hypothetical protein